MTSLPFGYLSCIDLARRLLNRYGPAQIYTETSFFLKQIVRVRLCVSVANNSYPVAKTVPIIQVILSRFPFHRDVVLVRQVTVHTNQQVRFDVSPEPLKLESMNGCLESIG